MVAKLTNDRNFRIKWTGPNDAAVELGDGLEIVRPIDLIRMHRELTEFIRFYGLAVHAEDNDDD